MIYEVMVLMGHLTFNVYHCYHVPYRRLLVLVLVAVVSCVFFLPVLLACPNISVL